MPSPWSAEEVAATVADHLAMLESELRGEGYVKRQHSRNLQRLLHDRSAGAIEFKHCNISAILIEMGLPYLDGYKPRGNYQELLRDELEAQLVRHPSIIESARAAVVAPVTEVPANLPLSELVVSAPVRPVRADRVYERAPRERRAVLDRNYLELEARNSALGRAGEAFALEVEHRRLWEAGQRSLAERIEHVSVTKGDGLGFDILSFETNGSERLIEVKTTSFGEFTPFFASKREVEVSDERAPVFNLYRVFKFRTKPRLFVLPGSLRASCTLDPVQYRASVA